MSRSQSTQPTVDELVSTLARSHIPSIVVEGNDDLMVYRWLESHVGPSRGSIFPCGGREKLLAVYNRRSEFLHLRTAFVADKDMWLFSAIPIGYEEMIWTTGYSIENDLYAGSRLENLLNEDELIEFRQVLSCIIEWFAFEVEEFRNGRDPLVNQHPNRIVELGTTYISPQFIRQREYLPPSQAAVQEIRQDYQLKVRGKTLFEVLARFLNAPNREPKHSIKALYEIGFKTEKEHLLMKRIVQDINFRLGYG